MIMIVSSTEIKSFATDIFRLGDQTSFDKSFFSVLFCNNNIRVVPLIIVLRLMTNHITFDTQLVHVVASCVHA